MEHEELAVRLAGAINGSGQGFPAYPCENVGDSRGMYVEIVTGPDELWTLWLERCP